MSVTFHRLWSAYPWGNPYADARTGAPPPGYDYQCAIKLSVALHRVGISMASYHGGGRIILDGLPTATRADDLALWLLKSPIPGIDTARNITGPGWRDATQGRTGIVSFSGCWPRSPQHADDLNGDHIDLWNGHRMTVTSATDGLSLIGRVLGLKNSMIPRSVPLVRQLSVSDFGASRRILFWQVA